MQSSGWQTFETVSVHLILVIAHVNMCNRIGFLLAARSGHPYLLYVAVRMFCAVWASHCKESNYGLGKKLNEKPVSQIVS